jgi:thiol-disulfide isomerase/thioredoxin
MFRRRALLASALLAVAAAPAPAARAEAPALQPFDQTAFESALEAGGPILVEISAPWCPTCKAQKAVLDDLLAAPEFAALTHLEVDFDTRKDVVRALGATQQSTLIVFAGGEEVGRSVGETRPEAIAALVRAAF